MTVEIEPVELIEEEESYSDSDKMYDIASWADRLALPVLIVLLIATFGQAGIQIYAIVNSGSSGSGLYLNLGYSLMNTLRDLGIATAAFFVLRAVAQVLYSQLDLQGK